MVFSDTKETKNMNNEKKVISGYTGSMRTRKDGSASLTIEFQEKDVQEAVNNFFKPNQLVALALIDIDNEII